MNSRIKVTLIEPLRLTTEVIFTLFQSYHIVYSQLPLLFTCNGVKPCLSSQEQLDLGFGPSTDPNALIWFNLAPSTSCLHASQY